MQYIPKVLSTSPTQIKEKEKESKGKKKRRERKKERWRKSRTYYMELIDKNPNDPQYYYGVYRTYFGEGRLEDAQEYLNKATALRGN